MQLLIFYQIFIPHYWLRQYIFLNTFDWHIFFFSHFLHPWSQGQPRLYISATAEKYPGIILYIQHWLHSIYPLYLDENAFIQGHFYYFLRGPTYALLCKFGLIIISYWALIDSGYLYISQSLWFGSLHNQFLWSSYDIPIIVLGTEVTFAKDKL